MHLADILSKVTYSAFRLYIYCQYVFPGNWTHNFALLTQCSTTEPQEHFFSGGKLKQPEEKTASFALGQLRFVEVLFVSYSEISETKNCHRKSKKMHSRFQPKWFWRTEIIDQNSTI